MEPVLPHVVPQTERQRSVHLLGPLGPGVALGSGRDRPGRSAADVLQLDDEEVLRERGRPVYELAVGVHEHRAAIEDELVLAPDRVHVHDPRAGFPRTSRAHVEALRALAAVVRRAVDVDDHLGSTGVVPVERRSRGPCVLAHGQSDPSPAELDGAARSAGLEIAALVEDAVVGELDLPVLRPQLATLQQRGGVVDAPLAPVDEPREHRTSGRRAAGELVEGIEVRLDEVRVKDEVLRGIAGDRELGEADDVRPSRGRADRPLLEALQVALQVTDGGVQLAERDPDHVDSLAARAGGVATRPPRCPGCRPPRPGPRPAVDASRSGRAAAAARRAPPRGSTSCPRASCGAS